MPPRPDYSKLESPFPPGRVDTEHYSTVNWYPSSGRHDAEKLRVITWLPLKYRKYWAQKYMPFLFSVTDASGLRDPDLEPTSGLTGWTPEKMLGSGGFGSVALWKRRNAKGTVVDEVAIKEQPHRPSNAAYKETSQMRKNGLSEEAVFHAGLQEKERVYSNSSAKMMHTPAWSHIEHSSHILWLRAYKYNDSNPPAKSRMYLLYAPHRTLEDLQDVYTAFGAVLPELFLWTVFQSLALALQAQQGALGKDSILYKYRARERDAMEDCIVHLDLKPLNILLDYATLDDGELDKAHRTKQYPDDLCKLYPRVCVTDYGISLDSHTKHGLRLDNDYSGWGTEDYRPPEHTHWGSSFAEPPNPNARIEPKVVAHDVWAVGKILFDLMTGSSPQLLNDEMMSCKEEQYIANGRHFYDAALDGYGKGYGSELRDLIRSCLSPRVVDRPTPHEIITTTRMHIQARQKLERSRLARGDDSFRLYFRNCDIGDLPLGAGPFPQAGVKALWDLQYRDPEYPITLPNEIWGLFLRTFPDDYRYLLYPPDMNIHHGVIDLDEGPTPSPITDPGEVDDRPPNGLTQLNDRSDVAASAPPNMNAPEQQGPAHPPEHPRAHGGPQVPGAIPPNQPQAAPAVAVDIRTNDPDVTELVNQNMKTIRGRLKRLEPTARTTGKGITKLYLAKKIVRLERSA